ncbi:MAG: ABC transporter ATP-binding protein, partial [Oscillospiraceae bacterium]|nr:ABC transporter ATP-binding protein [Oscillospiraceae bacterium]
MREYLPILIVGAIIGSFSLAFVLAYFALQKSKEKFDDNERHMADKEIIRRLLAYAKPYWKNFVAVFFVMLFSIVYDLISPLLIGHIQDTIKGEFELSYLFSMVGVYAGILVVSLICTYLQAMILQKTGQKILSQLRLDVFTHIEKLSHEQLNNIPVGKLVTRVTNDPNRISFLFTNILVTLAKNSMVVIGVLTAMFILNYALTLMILCFVPFVVLFTIIFQKFSRKVHRQVTNSTTDINTYLSENLSGMKITQIFNQEDRKQNDFMKRSAALRKAKYNRMYV